MTEEEGDCEHEWRKGTNKTLTTMLMMMGWAEYDYCDKCKGFRQHEQETK